ncbi:MAG: FAD-binding oxidoreductase [Gammaproteobacteria bacterium]|nr:FAD-binding oxidoreductase [Gammaproteobacteria bacterium]
MNRRKFCQSTLAVATVAALFPAHRALAAALMEIPGDIDAITAAGQQATLRQASVQELADSLRGPLLLPGNQAYEMARQVLNPAIDKRPALIVQPSGVADVSSAVHFARENNLVVAVKCGGHSTSGKSTCNGGMMIDLSRFRHVRVDPAEKLAYVSGGSLLGLMDHECMAHGLVTVAGTVSHTGVGGLTTGGGFGRLARRFGLALDNVRALDVVSADGRLRHASKVENPDLYWGVRGAGGNFGVVTSFEFNLHAMDRQVIAGNLFYPMSRLRDLLAFYAEFSMNAPDELATDLVAGYPSSGKDGFVLLALCYSGPATDADKIMAPVKSLGKPMLGEIKSVDYVALQRSGDNTAPRSTASYLKGGFPSEISPQLIDTLVEGMEPHPDRSVQIIFQQAGGAISRVPAAATAFAHRYAQHDMIATVSWKPDAPAAEHVRYIKRYWSALQPFTHGFYTNEADEDNARMVNKNYQGNYSRLLGIKRRYDPGNIFRLNANIRPTA